ncbi:MAG: hypothetical protein SynsKO_45480 [Synoicihabitans sp.]
MWSVIDFEILLIKVQEAELEEVGARQEIVNNTAGTLQNIGEDINGAISRWTLD